MDLSEIEQRYARHIKPNYGTVTPDELNFIQEMVDKHHPQSFVEIGMASGMSTGFIACFMGERGGGDLLSRDHDDQFPDSHRIRSTANEGNIFAVDLNMDQARFEALLTDLFKLPWSMRTAMSPEYVAKIDAILKRDYSGALHSHFMRCLEANNTPLQAQDGLTTRIAQLQAEIRQLQNQPGKGLLARLLGRS